MEQKKPFLKIQSKEVVISVAITVFIILIIFLFSYKPDKNSSVKNVSSENENKESLIQNNGQEKEINELKERIAQLENKPTPKSQTIYKTISSKSAADIIAEWKNRVAQVTCEWRYTDGSVYQIATGSSTLVDMAGNGLTAITNKHVIQADNGYPPKRCMVHVWGIGFREIKATDKPFLYTPTTDLGAIKLTISEEHPLGVFSEISGVKHCTTINIGDKLVVLGYPTIGAETGITATEGIIAGIEQDYYVTDAKIDHGNSGGAAILLKDDCWLGIPSASRVGEIESMGRILKSSLVFKNK
ncbi:MAG: serine protease [Candidatus Paceibacterota bacterium]